MLADDSRLEVVKQNYTERKMMSISPKSLEMGTEMNKMRFNLKKKTKERRHIDIWKAITQKH